MTLILKKNIIQKLNENFQIMHFAVANGILLPC